VRDRAELIAFYRSYGVGTFANAEPGYAEVCASLEAHPAVVDLLMEQAPEAQQPNLLFAAVHYLLLGEPGHSLLERFQDPKAGAVAPAFAAFVNERRNEIAELLATRHTQTNEVGRSAVLALMLNDAARRTGSALAWVDLGASAGLNLAIDHFRIDYAAPWGQRLSTGPADASVQLASSVGFGSPAISADHAPVDWRVGIDRHPIDLNDPSQVRWLQACLWPSQLERQQRLGVAVAQARAANVQVIEADAVTGLEQAIGQAPLALPLVITTTWVWYYLPEQTRQAIRQLLGSLARPVYWYSLEGRGVVQELELELEHENIESAIGRVIYNDRAPGSTSSTLLGEAHAHGAWINWFD